MFDEINGLPAHPLVVHAAVMFVPLLCVAALVYALVPRFRAATWWAAGALGVISPLAAYLATATGEELLEARYPGQPPEQLHQHEELGEATFFVSLALGVVTLALVYFTGTASGRSRGLPSWATMLLSGVAVLLALVAGYYVVRTGDSGAQSVWGV